MFVYELDIRTFRELWFFLFRKKVCPRCHNKVYRVDALPQHSQDWEGDGLRFFRVRKTKIPVRYRCDPCHAYFSITELATGS